MIDAAIWDNIIAKVKAGWCQGNTWLDAQGKKTIKADKAKKVCLIGACMLVIPEREAREPYYEALRKGLPPKYHGGIVCFNDDHNTTKKNVIELIKAAKANA